MSFESQPATLVSDPDFVEFSPGEVEQSIADRFVQQARRVPGNLALTCEDQKFTYAELHRAAHHVARSILMKCDRGDQPVALLMKTGSAAIAALLGALKAGRTYVPLDPAFPLARLQYMGDAVRPAMWLTDEENFLLAEKLAGAPEPVMKIRDVRDTEAGEDPDVPVSADHAACILFTSGSTGKPKPLIQSHRNLLHVTFQLTNALRIGATDRISMLTSISVAASTADLFPALLNGASLHIFDVTRKNFSELAAWLTLRKISIFHSFPTLFHQFMKALPPEAQFPSVRLVRLCGETFHAPDADFVQTHFSPACRLFNSLGTTEAGVVSLYEVNRRDPHRGRVVPVGKALPGIEILLLDKNGKKVAAGDVGEVVVKTRYHYLSAATGEQVIRTGDLGRWLPDGNLEHLGRHDSVVKIRGFRVELSEIEALLLSHPSVRQAAVTARDHPEAGQQLVAFVVPTDPGAVTVADLRKSLGEALPDYMIPHRVVFLGRLPVLVNGKLDRQALAGLDSSHPARTGSFIAPRDEFERALAGIWKKILNVDRVGAQDDFFELGGDSIQGLALVNQLQSVLGESVPVAILSETSTVAGLAGYLRKTHPRSVARLAPDETNLTASGARPVRDSSPFQSLVVPIQPRGVKPPFFCVPPGATTILSLVKMSRQLGDDQPFYGLQYPGLDGLTAPARSVEELAEQNLRAIRSVQPQGPYYLGGMCSGGKVALETARQLLNGGERVALLVILDGPAPGSSRDGRPSAGPGIEKSKSRRLSDFPRRFGKRLRRWRKRVLRNPRSYFRLAIQRWRLLFSRQGRAIRNVWRANCIAGKMYRPFTYPEPITLLLSEQRAGNQWFTGAWKKIAGGGLHIHILPGSRHGELHRNPRNAKRLAALLADILTRAQADAGADI